MATDPPDSHETSASRERRIAFAGGLVGALVGGLFSLGGTWLTLHDQAHRETQAQERLAVGAARVMIASFDNGVRYLCRLGRERRFIRITPDLRPDVAIADRELVAGELDADESLAVAEGDQAMANWEALYPDLRKDQEELGAEFEPYSFGLNRGIGRAMQARIALEGTAHYDEAGREPCDFKSWDRPPESSG
jgi:hypothetical protein